MHTKGLTQPQVAAALGVSPTTVKRALAKAMQTAGADALSVDGVLAGQRFSAWRTVARGGEPWRFAVAGLDSALAPSAPPPDRAMPTVLPRREEPADASAATQIAWLRAEIERRDAALEREQLANAELRRLLLALRDGAEHGAAGVPTVPRADGNAAAGGPLTPAAVERAAKDAGFGKKQRRDLLDRLGMLAAPEAQVERTHAE